MRGCAGTKRSCFIPIIDPLLGAPKTLPRDRSNRHYLEKTRTFGSLEKASNHVRECQKGTLENTRHAGGSGSGGRVKSDSWPPEYRKNARENALPWRSSATSCRRAPAHSRRNYGGSIRRSGSQAPPGSRQNARLARAA